MTSGGPVESERRQVLKEIGAILRARRESLGLSLKDVEEQTKLKPRYLALVEEGDDSSPYLGTTYFKAYLKSYADFLGLEGTAFSRKYQELIDRERSSMSAAQQAAGARTGRQQKTITADTGPARAIDTETPPARGAQEPVVQKELPHPVNHGAFPRHARRRKVRRNLWLPAAVTLVLLAGLFYGLVYWHNWRQPQVPPRTPETAEQPSQPSVSIPGTDHPGTSQNPTPVRRTDSDRETTIFSAPFQPLDLVLRVEGQSEPCWLRIVSDGSQVFEGTLNPGQERQCTGQKEIRVLAGKPWTLRLILNGVDLGIAGPVGPVKEIVLRSER